MTLGDLRALYQTSRWRRAAHAFLRLHPTCARPACGRRSQVVDHIVPRSRARDAAELLQLTWDRSNWQALCKSHHDEKTRLEQGWGQRRASKRALPTLPSAVVTRDYSRGVA
jgi:5-methylcytosine-specific restriction protein A